MLIPLCLKGKGQDKSVRGKEREQTSSIGNRHCIRQSCKPQQLIHTNAIWNRNYPICCHCSDACSCSTDEDTDIQGG